MSKAQTYFPDHHQLAPEQIDQDARDVVAKLQESGYEAYIVGGAVRDLLLKRHPKDFDVVTAATPRVIRKLFRRSRTIGKRFQIVHVYAGKGKVIEVSTFRRLLNDDNSDETEENLWGTPEEDARRRDLTINAFLLDPLEMVIYDYIDGMADLHAGRIRILGGPAERIREDPVRMIRAIRHAARTGFLIEDHTWEAILDHCQLITECNRSRVQQELNREFQEGAAARSTKLLHRSGLLAELLPELDTLLNQLHSRPAAKRFYWRLLKLLDRRGIGEDLPTALVFAVVFGPVIEPAILRVLNKRDKLQLERLIADAEPILTKLGVTKALAEPIAQAIYAQPRLDRARRTPETVGKLRKKSYYPLALTVCITRHQALGSELPERWLEEAPPLSALKRERKSRRRRNRKRRGKPKGRKNAPKRQN